MLRLLLVPAIINQLRYRPQPHCLGRLVTMVYQILPAPSH